MIDTIETETDVLFWDNYMDLLEFSQKSLSRLKIEGYLNLEEELW